MARQTYNEGPRPWQARDDVEKVKDEQYYGRYQCRSRHELDPAATDGVPIVYRGADQNEDIQELWKKKQKKTQRESFPFKIRKCNPNT